MLGTAPMIDLRHLAACCAMVLASPAALASPELARSKNCVACHHVERKMNGPPYKAIAERYAKDEAAQKALIEKVRKGGGGVWGPMAMPAQPTLSEEDAEALIKWIMSQP
jgi:cytochrome c